MNPKNENTKTLHFEVFRYDAASDDAERSGDLDDAFDLLSADMAEEVDTRSARVLALLEPAAILLMFILVIPRKQSIAIPLLTVRIGT